MKCFSFGIVFFKPMWPCTLNFEKCWGYLMPLSETFVHSRAYLSLRKQPPSSGFVSLWSPTWPLCLQARRSACIPLTLTPKFQFCILPGTCGPQDHCFPRPYAGGKHVAISSARMEGTWHELLPISFIVLSLLKRLWLNSPHQVLCLIKRFNRISLFFNLFIAVPVGRLKLWYSKHQSWALCVQKWTLTLWFTFLSKWMIH